MAAVEDITKEASKELPYFILGHSMGSYLLREYLGIYDDRLSGAIIMGTGYESDKDTSRGLKLISLLSKLKGERHRSKLVKKMTMGKAYETSIDFFFDNHRRIHNADDKYGGFRIGDAATAKQRLQCC